MATLNARIIAKGSASPGEVPIPADLEVAELAINTADGLIFSKNTDGSIVTIGDGGSYNDLDDLPDLSLKADLVNGVVPTSQLPPIAISSYLGSAINEAAMLALSGQEGDWCDRTDTGTVWILSGPNSTLLSNWIELASNSGVTSVNGATGVVLLNVNDIGDVDAPSPTDGQILRWVSANNKWEASDGDAVTEVNGQTGVVSLGIRDLTDVHDVPAASGQMLAWDTSLGWTPVNAPSPNAEPTVYTPTRVTQTQTSAAATGHIEFPGIGAWSNLVSISSTSDVWVTLYVNAAARAGDVSRGFSQDPVAGDGILSEFYLSAGSTVLATPGTTLFNNDTPATNFCYALCRNTFGSPVVATVSLTVYTVGTDAYDGVDGGTFGSG